MRDGEGYRRRPMDLPDHEKNRQRKHISADLQIQLI